MTLYESASGAVRPWNSLDAESEYYSGSPQQSIKICLNCKHCASRCDNCSDWNTARVGRPMKTVDSALFLEMMHLKRRNAEMCAALGVSKRTLQRRKKILKTEGETI